MKLVKIVLGILSLLFLVYLLMPGPTSIKDFSPLPDSVKSTEEGDTIQVPNVSAYFSNFFRPIVIPFYKQEMQKNTLFPFPPLELNYPPEFAFTAIKDQTQSTYLEEFVYPLRESTFVNGFEPFYENGRPKYLGATQIVVNQRVFNSKTTLRYYPSSLWARMVVWLGVNISIFLLWKLIRGVKESV